MKNIRSHICIPWGGDATFEAWEYETKWKREKFSNVLIFNLIWDWWMGEKCGTTMVFPDLLQRKKIIVELLRKDTHIEILINLWNIWFWKYYIPICKREKMMNFIRTQNICITQLNALTKIKLVCKINDWIEKSITMLASE